MPRPLIAQGAQPRIVVVGGGFAGATAARFLKRSDPRLDVTLVEPNAIFSACPMSNEVIAGLRDMRRQMFGYEEIGKSLANDCDAGTAEHWDHEQLKHNDAERHRLVQTVKPFLF